MSNNNNSNSNNNLSTKCLVYSSSRNANGGSTDTIALVTKTIPSRIPRNHVLVQVHAAGLNPVDAKRVIGDKLPRAFHGLSSRVVKGCTIGFEFSGTVVQTSETDDAAADATAVKYKKGDQVFGSMPPFAGTMSDYIVAPHDQIALKPSNLSHCEAACLVLVGLTALQALTPHTTTTTSSRSASTSIVIVGASGGTGHVALQVARLLGFTTIVAICSTPNADFCKALGATHVIDYTKSNDIAKDVKLAVVVAGISSSGDSDGGVVDIVLDCVTSVDPRDAQHDYPRKLRGLCRNKYIRLGGPPMDWFYAGCERIMPWGECFTGKEKLFWIRFPKSSEELELLKSWCEEGSLKPRIQNSYDFSPDSVEQAMQQILSRRVQGKCVVKLLEE